MDWRASATPVPRPSPRGKGRRLHGPARSLPRALPSHAPPTDGTTDIAPNRAARRERSLGMIARTTGPLRRMLGA